MVENTKIEWADHTFNPWIGCAKVSAGCDHCYAELLMDTRYGRVEWGPNGTRVRTSASNWKKPIKWDREAKTSGVRKRVFCASLADVFEHREEILDWRCDLIELIEKCRHLDWLILTKRPENVTYLISRATGRFSKPWLADNNHVQIGTSVENQEQADKRIPELLQIPAAVRFLSCEPLLGPVDLTLDGLSCLPCPDCIDLPADYETNVVECRRCDSTGIGEQWGIDWVIVGGESGPSARPCAVEWIRDIRDQCRAAGVPCFIKQLGGLPYTFHPGWDEPHPFDSVYDDVLELKDKKCGDWSEWPEDLRVREFPGASEVKGV